MKTRHECDHCQQEFADEVQAAEHEKTCLPLEKGQVVQTRRYGHARITAFHRMPDGGPARVDLVFDKPPMLRPPLNFYTSNWGHVEWAEIVRIVKPPLRKAA